MTNQAMELRICQVSRARRERARRYELINAIVEGLVTLGIGASFILCSILFLCAI